MLCQYSGDVRHSDLIICGHDYTSYLIDLDQLTAGDEIIFTEVNGRKHSYTVGWFELLGGLEGEKLDDKSEDWDLTVFTCTWSGYSRVVMRCQACTPGPNSPTPPGVLAARLMPPPIGALCELTALPALPGGEGVSFV